jgi:hypothetical protein
MKSRFALLFSLSSTLLFSQQAIDFPSANPELRNSWNGFAEASFLYWWTQADDLAFALSETKVKNPHFKPEIGFKVGAGAFLPHDDWDFLVELTHLHSRATANVKHGPVTPLWTTPPEIAGGFVDQVHGHYRLHFALIDFELGHKFFITRSLILRPYVGVRMAIIRQKYLIDYIGGNLFPEGKGYVSMKNKFIAPGLLNGIDLDWKLKRGWSLYSTLGFSIQYGMVYIHQLEKISFEEGKRFNIYDCFTMAKPILDLALGFQWETYLCKKRYHFALQAGLEQHLFFAQNQLFRFAAHDTTPLSLSHGILSLTGLTASLIFSY